MLVIPHMKRLLPIILLSLFSWALFGQTESSGKVVSFEAIFQNFNEYRRGRLSGQIEDSVTKSSIYKSKHFHVSISKKPIVFDTAHVVLENPYYTEDFDDYDDNYINYPVSYSVIYDQKLIALFRNGKFVSYDLENLNRNIPFEEKLNTRIFKYHWIINGQLHALSGSSVYVWTNESWIKSKLKLPLNNQPILFEDSNFIVFGDCYGEWGGTVYFFDKDSGETYFTESTCTNSVLKNNDKYTVLSHLGHMFGSSEVKVIDNPSDLSKAKKRQINRTKDGQALGYADKSEAYTKELDLFGIQLFSTFKYGDRQLYLTYLKELTFLAEINGTEIQIVNPLFNNEIYTHNPTTKVYGDYTLINLDLYGTARDKEVSLIVVHKNQITKIDWNKNQDN